MQHLDDGVLNALLDGELTGAERAEADRHLESCQECRDRLAEARAFMAEADGLVEALEAPPAREKRETGMGKDRDPGIRPRRMDYRALAWAATVVLALGLGYVGGARLHLPVSPEEQQALEQPRRQAADRAVTPEHREAVPPAAPQPTTEKGAKQSAVEVPSPTPTAEVPATAEPGQPTQGKTAEGAPRGDLAVSPESPAETILSIEKGRRDESAAYIDGVPTSAEYRGNAFAPAPSAAARVLAPRDQLAGAAPSDGGQFRRITWDTAITVLGGAVRLIDGLTPNELGMADGGAVGGFETGRPVVRIRYLFGGRDTLDLLEQRLSAVRQERKTAMDSAMVLAERALPGGGSEVRWRAPGGFLLVLRSALTAERLAELAARVR